MLNWVVYMPIIEEAKGYIKCKTPGCKLRGKKWHLSESVLSVRYFEDGQGNFYLQGICPIHGVVCNLIIDPKTYLVGETIPRQLGLLLDEREHEDLIGFLDNWDGKKVEDLF